MYCINIMEEQVQLLQKSRSDVEKLIEELGFSTEMLKGDKLCVTKEQYKHLMNAFAKYISETDLVAISVVGSLASFVPEFYVGLCEQRNRMLKPHS